MKNIFEKLVSYRRYTYALSGIIVAVSIAAVVRFGLLPGIDFTGGTLMEIGCTADTTDCTLPTANTVNDALAQAHLTAASIQKTDAGTLVIRYARSTEAQNEQVMSALRAVAPGVVQKRVDFIGASVSQQLRANALKAIVISLVVITLYIAWAFRKVSFFVSSWGYGVSAIVALIHDITIVMGVFALLGHYKGVEVGVSFVAALLTVLGYSVNDTIVVYDRVRENILRLGKKKTFEEIVNQSIFETLARSVNTSMTVVVVLIAILLFGGASLFYFALALLIGVVAGTYSSIFVATALLVTFYNYRHRARHKEA